MKEILILSGKGGAGKTTIAACFCQLAAGKAVFADCDVDASNLPLLLAPEELIREKFFAGQIPEISSASCSGCGKCAELCRFSAIDLSGGKAKIIEGCEGCGVCADNCPEQAVTLHDRLCGHLMISETSYGRLFHAELLPGAENSGKLVAQLRQNGRKYAENCGAEYLICDGPPGLGCPVISSITGIDHAVIVTEPTVSGLHDMKRLATLLHQFEVPFSLVINKSDLNPDATANLTDECGKKQIPVLGTLPFDRAFSTALSRGKSILDSDEKHLSGKITGIWKNLTSFLKEGEKS